MPAADELGFWAAIVPDHYMWGAQMGGDSTLDSWLALSYLSAETRNMRLGTLVTPIPLRPPAQLAKIVSTLDLISNGRAILGVGAGWSQGEFEGYGEWDEPNKRVQKTEEGIRLILRLWNEHAPVNFNGKYYHARGAVLEPKPAQKPHPPLLFGGTKRYMFKLAGRYADICYVPPWTEFSYEDAKKIVLEEARRSLRDVKFASGAPSARDIPYNLNTVSKLVEDAEKSGCEFFVIPFPHETYLDSMREFARNVIPSYTG